MMITMIYTKIEFDNEIKRIINSSESELEKRLAEAVFQNDHDWMGIFYPFMANGKDLILFQYDDEPDNINENGYMKMLKFNNLSDEELESNEVWLYDIFDKLNKKKAILCID